ncbi:MAG: hypothetical protein N3F10_06605 [Candidatus Bathyarchaeota archaeon]|nr:hypothetical protein [Candidatus Bathyarchaeota archaeon]
MRTETVEVGDEFSPEFRGCYVFQEITWAKRSRIIQKYTKYHPLTGHVVSSDYVAIQAETIWASLKEQPPHKPITLERLLGEDPEKGIPIGLGELFSQVVNRLNSVSRDEAGFLRGQCVRQCSAKPSQSSGSAESSDGPLTSSGSSRQKQSSSSSSS